MIKMRKEQKEDLRNVMKVMSNAHKTEKHYFVLLQRKSTNFLFNLYTYYTLLETKSNNSSTLLENPNIMYKTSVYKD